MKEATRCSGCGQELAVPAKLGHCPSCLLQLAQVTETEPDAIVMSQARLFGDYELLEQIGRGGMGVVYKARHRKTHQIVALKLLREEVSSPVAVRRFVQEADAAASLDHPNIIRIHEVGEANGQCFFSMDLIEAKSLNQLIAADGFRPEGTAVTSVDGSKGEAAARLMATIARAVDYAHQRKIIHRDLKPSNILVDGDGKPYLTDFGLAKLAGGDLRLTRTGSVLGTPHYMSPEQAAGENDALSMGTDIYSLGVIFYEMLTGQTPFQGVTPLETMAQVTKSMPDDPCRRNPGVDRELAIICLKCLEKKPERRYVTAAALAEDLERWLRNEPIQARLPGLSLRAWRWTVQHPIPAVVMLFLVCLSAVALVLLDKRDQVYRGLRASWALKLDKFWDESKRSFEEVTSEELAFWNGEILPPISPGSRTVRLRFAVYSWQKPAIMLEIMAPMLGRLQETMRNELAQRVEIDLRLYRTYDLLREDLVKGEVDFARVGPGVYVEARNQTNIVLLLAQNGPIRGYIFAKRGSGITGLPSLRGRRIAFVNDSSTCGHFLSKDALTKKGFKASDFVGGGTNFLKTHDLVVEAVARGVFEAGAANAGIVDDYARDHGVDFEVLHEFGMSIGLPWVAAAGLNPRLADSIRAGLKSIRKENLLLQLGNRTTGFVVADDRDFDQLRDTMKKVGDFDGR